MIYPANVFKSVKKFPFFYSNFVTTIDGKVGLVSPEGQKYWPIGSRLDFETLLWLRAQADVLIHGSKTAKGFNTLQTLAKKEFSDKRKKLGKKKDLIYMVLSNHPDEKLFNKLKNPPTGVKSYLVTGGVNAHHPWGDVASHIGIDVLKLDRYEDNLEELSDYFKKNNLQKILVEGGPTVMSSFLKENLMDEIFITIAPKIFGSNRNTKTMVEGFLFPARKVPRFKLISVKNIDSELYLRYRKGRK